MTAQPTELKVDFVETIAEASKPKNINGVGVNFLKWCWVWDLHNLSKAPDEMAAILNKSYPHG